MRIHSIYAFVFPTLDALSDLSSPLLRKLRTIAAPHAIVPQVYHVMLIQYMHADAPRCVIHHDFHVFHHLISMCCDEMVIVR